MLQGACCASIVQCRQQTEIEIEACTTITLGPLILEDPDRQVAPSTLVVP